MADFKKFMVLRFGSLGDALLTTPFLRALKTRRADAHIDYFTKPAGAQLLRGNPHISVIHELEGGGIFDLAGQVARMGDENYDLVIDLHRNLRSWYSRTYMLTKKSVKMRRDRRRRWLLTHVGVDRYGEDMPSMAVRYFNALEGLFEPPLAPDGGGLDLFLDDKDRREADDALGEDGPFMAVAPSAHWPTKRWLPERFADLADILAQKLDAKTLLLGDEADKGLTAEVASRMKTPVLNLAGKLSIRGTAAAIERSELFIGNDTGLTHVASALNKPGVAIYGPTTRHLGFFPYKSEIIVVENRLLECRPCTKQGDWECPAGHFRCMTDISVGDALDGAMRGVGK